MLSETDKKLGNSKYEIKLGTVNLRTADWCMKTPQVGSKSASVGQCKQVPCRVLVAYDKQGPYLHRVACMYIADGLPVYGNVPNGIKFFQGVHLLDSRVLIENGFSPQWVMLEKDIRSEITNLKLRLEEERKKLGKMPLKESEKFVWNKLLDVLNDDAYMLFDFLCVDISEANEESQDSRII
ncbi:hypothetical protein OUZ56_009501 [Daphnia magna]|uniref:Uncharacterized protein n=1 Tax=Daphnia magna TaxID=35525 RepID=A0ABR0AGC2_9CRUS|nr:hypothetical protein OUZ56_009501 [Daphnia magna]